MKILILGLFLLVAVYTVPHPQPYCRTAPFPSLVPITINSTLRFDLQNVFDGYNLIIDGPDREHIDVIQKYKISNNSYGQSMNFTSAKIKQHNRFLGLITHDEFTQLAIGTNHPQTGVTIQTVLQIQDVPHMHCYDVDQILSHNSTFAIIDCGVFSMGVLQYNEFIYVDLQTKKVVIGRKVTDTFVHYNFIEGRKIQVIEDPFTRLVYLVRIILRDGVDTEHKNQTYIEIFFMRSPMDPQILDVIDHTFLQQSHLSIADYQIQFGNIYFLAYNRGVYEVVWNRNHYFTIRSFFELKMDITRFRVDRRGFNDDLKVIAANQNMIYQFQWDVTTPPKLMKKYGMIPNSEIQQLICDYDYIIVLSKALIDDQLVRKVWIFTERSTSYTHAYNAFDAPEYGPAIMQWDQFARVLHVFHEYTSYNVRMSLPYLEIKPVAAQMAGKTEQYIVSAISTSNNQNITCEQKFNFIYHLPGDNSIIKTGFGDKQQIVVDSPDTRKIDLMFQFYGKNLTYDVKFQTNSSILPYHYIDKQHKAIFNWPQQIKPQTITFYQMFQERNILGIIPNAIFGLVQTEQNTSSTTSTYTVHYVRCQINVFDRDETHHLTCKIISSNRFSMGKILLSSQMFDTRQRRIALTFQNARNTVMIYYFWDAGFGFYGRKDYAGDAANILTGITISKGKLFCTLQYGKRVDIFNLQQLQQPDDVPRNADPMMVLNSTVMRFFGVEYFAPVNTKVSQYHDELVFLKTKTGVMAININQQAFPQLLFQIKTDNIKYDFEVNHQNLLIITQTKSELYQMYTPLRRQSPPYLRQTINYNFTLGEYDQICADKFFYIVGNNDINVINPFFHSSTAVYSQISMDDPILSVDSVYIKGGRQILFMRTKKQMIAWVFAESPALYVSWSENHPDFKMKLKAFNPNTTSDEYNLNFTVLRSNETEIKPTQKFNANAVRKLGHIKQFQNQDRKFTFNLTLNDTQWFDGNVFHFLANCTSCGKNIHLINHVTQVRQMVVAKAIYDMQSTFNGIYAQQYSSVFKTWAHNDSIQYIIPLPVQARGQVCSKITIQDGHTFFISLCQTGTQVNAYITSLATDKPFTIGPFMTEAKAVNHAKVVGDILMIVDNDDDPFERAGGVYLYALNFDTDDNIDLALIDYLDVDDLNIQGFNGLGYIGSADLHQPHISEQYRIFLTEGGTGSIFVFTFILSKDGQQIIYLSKKMIALQKFMPPQTRPPTPMRVMTINIHYYVTGNQDKSVKYYLLLTLANWHHMEISITLDYQDNMRDFKLHRMFQRFPWKLQNYIKFKRGWSKSQFAVPYIDTQIQKQIIAVYEAPFIVTSDLIQQKQQDQLIIIPIIPMLGVHRVNDTFQTAYAFHSGRMNTMLFSDMDGYNITQLAINQNLTLQVKDLAQPQNVTIIAHNPYTNFSFTIQVNIIDETVQQRQQIIWIVILAIGVIMIIGLITVYVRQSKSPRTQVQKLQKQSLLTVDDKFKDQYINRTSVDPQSVRDTVDLRDSKQETIEIK